MSNRQSRQEPVGAAVVRVVAVRALVAAALIAGASAEAGAAGDAAGYLTSTDASAITDSDGACWHTGEWTPQMRFGRCEPRPAKAAALPRMAAPARMAVKPEPKPVPFRMSTDALFDFDSASLKPEGRAPLDGLESRIAHADYRSVEIIGHADPIGSPSYNRRLSERRAQAVRDYLVAHGADGRKVTARGVGSDEPETAAGDCRGLGRARLIECLQPDRYAEAVVRGSAPQKSAMR